MTTSFCPPPAVLRQVEAERQRHLDDLFSLIRIPSVSAHGAAVRECAAELQALMRRGGIAADILETDNQPVVYGQAAGRQGAPTVLFYGHYDVQPPDPLDQWVSPPFEPTIRNGRVYGRGAGDNKGQLLAHVYAVQAYLAAGQELPVNVKFLIEGEEEIGSPHLEAFAASNRERLAADVVVTSDGPKHESGGPQLFFGLRGLLYIELEARGANRDLHSGNKGGLAPNPAMALCRLAASFKTADNRVAVEGFYENVLAPTAYERELMARIPFDEELVRQDLGLEQLDRVGDLGPLERLMFEPTLNICGFHSGYGGPGSKTVIPSTATMKIDMRLVANQDPDDIWRKMERHVHKHAPGINITRLGPGTAPSKTRPDLPACQAVIEAVRQASGADPVVLPTLGASMPDYIFTRVLGVPSIGIPYANPDENNHSPNENLALDDFYAGIVTSTYILEALGALTAKGV
jgi:acetylornithine deacetylase/succinyl-diaminopimelate desuccinylase-like protein